MGVLHPIGLLRHRRITFFATLSGTLCREADISCPKVQLSHNRLAQHNGCSLCASALGTRRTLWSLPKATTSLVHVVAANWSLGTQLKAPQPDRSLTFFGAKIADTFMQLNANCAHGPYRCVMSS
jgi:hypothetical protein